ncbi:MAG: PEP-CTERM sorting domain-containing protein [Kiritimatiellae bacterium]|jgi:hypothetical protein|nr:PEP-CTERM sorting domain-containing protein [Kiritimatiellia bacterium]
MKLTHFSSLLSLTIALVTLQTHSAGAAILASWDDWSNATTPISNYVYASDNTLAGFTASLELNTITTPTNRANGSFGSSDGSFGTESGASTSTTGLLVRGQHNEFILTLTLTNTSGQAYLIDGFHFDFAPRSQDSGSNGPNGFTLEYTSGGLGPTSTGIASQTELPYHITNSTTNAASNFPDFDYSLTSVLSDISLDDNESAIFTLTFLMPDNNYSANVSSVVDNVAFSGSVIPEPGTIGLMLLGLGVVGMSCAQRYKTLHRYFHH